ncbi:ribonuclease PH [candidate division WOR-3 bacterium]|nr:ribonuclease PH [candidate division WOR-3 bacterium]
MQRFQARSSDSARKIEIIAPYQKNVPGSCLCKYGDTWVCCSVSISEGVPAWLKGKGHGWLSAEYGMLPGSSPQRVKRERMYSNSRSLEIGRLIGRSLRAAIDVKSLPQNTYTIDCDVIQADGGTRTASITGSWVALVMAVENQKTLHRLKSDPVIRQIGAVSAGFWQNKPLVDLDYSEDSSADFDANFVFTKDLDIVEIQSSAEGYTITRKEFSSLLDMVTKAMPPVFKAQDEALNSLGIPLKC